MKKLTTISLFIFWAITVAILIAGLVFYQDRNNLTGQINSVPENPAGVSLPAVNKAGGLTLNLTEISKHNSIGNCWLIINNKIYNVAGYLSAHPGGAGMIIPYCGKDATQAFATKGGRGSHSSFADSLLANYLIGSLNQTIAQQQIQQNVNNTNLVIPSAGGEDEEDD